MDFKAEIEKLARALPAATSPPTTKLPPPRNTARARERERGTGPTHAGVSATRQAAAFSPGSLAGPLPASPRPCPSSLSGSAPGVAVQELRLLCEAGLPAIAV
ncbi:hypothetical protein GSI_04879 [Ganoderma sinense ZZ0214-1]|uniref:Uncharacterized protein n=1 Tax=Ganoderma sinense ZZ0214-1 TaxID=1077348 RepID=A0A2G8SG80_9APHY|nr:hypothetical protein GSI_04879 [Ganoderma sinense ZZ0214-1]